MFRTQASWTVVLAAGSGTRLATLTRLGSDASVPKQFCSLSGGGSLLEETLERARAMTPPERTVIVVAAEHREFWAAGFDGIPDENIVVQPRNRGTAFGILLGVATVLGRDPAATVIVLPSDHFVAEEDVLRQAMSRALGAAAASRNIYFLGIRPEAADPELGYIVRGALEADGSYRIASFVEKPSRLHAAMLLAESALWNSFILVGRARALVDLVAARRPREVAALLRATRSDARLAANWRELDELYAQLPTVDFSRDIVQGSCARLRVLPVAGCGWSDLGTPLRVAECLARIGVGRPRARTAHLSLAEAHARLTGPALRAGQVAS